MKEILTVVLLLGTVLLIYIGAVAGPDGMQSKVSSGGGKVHTTLRSMDP